MTDTITFGRAVDDIHGDVFVLAGPHGAVVFSNAGIDVHAPAPFADWHASDDFDSLECQYLGGAPCWVDGGSTAGHRLRRQWEASGRDDAVIEAELYRWYEAHVGGAS